MALSLFARAVLGCTLAFAAAAALAQAFPVKPVRIIVSATAGGFMDLIARGLAPELSRAWDQPVLVENRAGANGIVATEAVVRSAPDGHSLLLSTSSLATNEFLYNSLPYDTAKDLTPVVGIAATSMLLVASASVNADSLAQLIELAKQKPGSFNYGSFGIGNIVSHIDMEALASLAGIKLTHIPFKGVPDVSQALMSGDVQIAMFGVAAAVPQIRSGKLKAIALAAPQRLNVIRNVPTFAESGIPFESRGWYGFVVRAGVSRGVMDTIARDVIRIASGNEYQKKYFTALGIEPMVLDTEQFAALVKSERATYAVRIRNVGIKLD